MKAFSVRCTEDQLRRWSNAAMAQGITRQEWVTRLLDAEVTRQEPRRNGWTDHVVSQAYVDAHGTDPANWPEPVEEETRLFIGPNGVYHSAQEAQERSAGECRVCSPALRYIEDDYVAHAQAFEAAFVLAHEEEGTPIAPGEDAQTDVRAELPPPVEALAELDHGLPVGASRVDSLQGPKVWAPGELMDPREEYVTKFHRAEFIAFYKNRYGVEPPEGYLDQLIGASEQTPIDKDSPDEDSQTHEDLMAEEPWVAAHDRTQVVGHRIRRGESDLVDDEGRSVVRDFTENTPDDLTITSDVPQEILESWVENALKPPEGAKLIYVEGHVPEPIPDPIPYLTRFGTQLVPPEGWMLCPKDHCVRPGKECARCQS